MRKFHKTKKTVTHRQYADVLPCWLPKIAAMLFVLPSAQSAWALSTNNTVPVEVQQCGYIGCWQDNNASGTPYQPKADKPSLPDYVGYAWIGKSNQIHTTKSYFYNSPQAEELSRLYLADTALSDCIAKYGACEKGGMMGLDAVTFGTHWLAVASAGTDDVFFGNWQTKKQANQNAISNCQNYFWQHADKGVSPEACKVIQTVGIKRFSSSEEHRLLGVWKQRHFSKP